MRPAGFSVFPRVTVIRRLLPPERPALPPSRSTLRAISAVAATVALVAGVGAAVLVALPAEPARAASGQLAIYVDRVLSLTGEAVTLTVKGTVSERPADAQLVVRIDGPAEPSQVGQSAPRLPTTATFSRRLIPSGGAVPGGTSGGGTTSGSATGGGVATTETANGVWAASVVLPANAPAWPGAYLLSVSVISGGSTWASSTAWLGKAAPRQQPLDVAFIWPVALGIHRDSSGAFFDRTLEDATAPVGENPESLQALLDVAVRFPGWRFTLAVEPILLAQLRDMADGYTRIDASGVRQEVGKDDPAARKAGQTLDALKALAGTESVDTAASPYAGPALGALAVEGWRDGFEQIQLGKQELQQTLGLGSTLTGAYSPDLDMTSGSLAYYGQAFIDHVVVDGGLAADLAEPVAEGTVAARVRDTENDRVTLVFANSGLRPLVAPPWDAGVLFAGLAAELASGTREALVIAPGVDFALPPISYLLTVGEVLSRLDWVKTQTLTSLLGAHAPATRPVLLGRNAPEAPGYIEGSLLTSLREAHAAVADLVGGRRRHAGSGAAGQPLAVYGGESLVVAPSDQPAGGEHRAGVCPGGSGAGSRRVGLRRAS